jgi:hypothetical protein
MALEKKSIDKQEETAGAAETVNKKPSGQPITVHSYAGFKQDERPRAFELEGRRLTVLSVKKVWQEEPEEGRRRRTIFRVHAHNGRTYDLVHDPGSGEWTLGPGQQRPSRG